MGIAGAIETKNRDESGEHGFPSAPTLLVLAASLLTGMLVPTPTLAGVDRKVSDICLRSTDAAYRAQYCDAAKDLKKGYHANLATSAVWTGVSVVCGAACGKTVAGLGCNVAHTGGAGGEALITKKFSDSLMGEATKWMGGTKGEDAKNAGEKVAGAGATESAAGSNAATEGATAVADAPKAEKKFDADACQTAGQTALKAFGKYENSKQNDQSLGQLRDQASGLNTANSAGAPTLVGDHAPKSTSPDEATRDAATAGSAEVCSEGARATALGAIRCAAESDPSLPPYAKSGEFLRDLQRATGQSPDAFFAGFESPAKSLLASPTARALPDSRQRGLVEALGAMEAYAERNAERPTANRLARSFPPSARDGATAGIDGGGIDINGLLGQLSGADSPKVPAEVADARFGDRRIAGVDMGPENRKVSIFDRVQRRYGAVTARDRLGER